MAEALRAAWSLYRTDERRDTLLALLVVAVVIVPTVISLLWSSKESGR